MTGAAGGAANTTGAAATANTSGTVATAVHCVRPFVPRPGVRLDGDMAETIRKLYHIDSLARSLPGRDCGTCCGPSCATFAEDVVMGRAATRPSASPPSRRLRPPGRAPKGVPTRPPGGSCSQSRCL